MGFLNDEICVGLELMYCLHENNIELGWQELE